MLSPSWLVKLGLLSYSAYLWHQPLFAFARLRSFDVPSPLVFGLLSVVSLALAYVSWRFVETPFRRPGQFSRRWIFSAGALSILVLLAFGLAGNIPLLVEAPYTAAQLAVLQPPKSTEDECPWQVPLAAFPAIESCGFGSGNLDAPVVLVGDSHAGALLGALGSRLRERGIGGVFLRNGQCRVIPGVYRSDRTADRLVRRCEEADRVFMAYLRGLKPRAMVVAIRWTFQLYPVEGQIDELGFDNGEGGVEEETPREYVARDSSGVFVTAADAKAKAVRDVLLAYAQLGVPVVVQYPVPEVGWNVPDLNFKHLLAEGEFPQSITTDHERYKRRHAFITAVLDGLADDHFIAAVRPDTLLCGQDAGGRCLAQRDGVPLYFDDDHLSREGSLGVADEIVKNIP